MHSSIGERLRRVRRFLGDDEVFLVNYGDVLTDAPLNEVIEQVRGSDDVAALLAVQPQESFHVLELRDDASVASLLPARDLSLRINGGYFVMRRGIFEFLNDGADLVPDALTRVAQTGRLRAVIHDGFWAPMDTLKEQAMLESRWVAGDAPWMVWADRSPSVAPVAGR
jgi:glucose-1-phosphate cytidylyltransferase